ncbi:MAG: serine/threonine-protein phosphatase [Lachnospiraceae bacterium]|nr:serine/threonine-protein phosphatase [Candidatus Colinaster scatohippi]
MKHMCTGFTDVGLKREVNQDAVFMKSDGNNGLFAVADGMGGHSHGEFASATIRDCLALWWDSFSPEYYEKDFTRMMLSLNQILEKANVDIRNSTPPGEICGSTVVVIFIYEDKYGMLTAGDSRVYTVEKRKIRQISVDETWENQPGNNLSPWAKMKHPNYGKLVNAIGSSDNFRLTSRTDLLKKGMIFVLCSDGIYKYADSKFLTKTLKHLSAARVQESLKKIRDNVYENGAKDNMSIVVVVIYE